MPAVALLIPIFSVIGFFVTFIWVAYMVTDAIRTRQKVKLTSDLQTKLLERITSVNDLGAFLQTDPGAEFLKGITIESEKPQMRILRAMQTGIVLGMLGLALFAFGWFSPGIPDAVMTAVHAVATIFLALGIGFLLSARLSYGLSRNMGLLEESAPRVAERQATSR